MLVRKKLKEGTEQWKKSPAELWTELCREATQEVGPMGVVLLGKEDNFKRYGPAFDTFRPFYPIFFPFQQDTVQPQTRHTALHSPDQS